MRNVTLILVALCTLAGCGAHDPAPAAQSAAQATSTAPPGTPFPSSVGGTLHAGTTYTTQAFTPQLQITPAPGRWVAEIGEIDTDLSVAKRGIDGQAILAFHRVQRVFDPVKGGRTPGDMVTAPEDFAAWLVHHPHLEAGKPVPVRRLGLDGVRVDVRAVSHPPRVPDECGRHADRCVPMLYDGTDVLFYTYGTVEARVRFYVLDLPSGGQLVAEEYFENPSDVKTQRPSLEQTLRDTTMG